MATQCSIAIVDKTQREYPEEKVIYLVRYYDGFPEVSGTDIRDIVEHWEQICCEDNIPAEIEPIANHFLGQIIPWLSSKEWTKAYQVYADVSPLSQFLFVITLNPTKRPRFIDIDAYKVPREYHDGAITDWREICTEENCRTIPEMKCRFPTLSMHEYLELKNK